MKFENTYPQITVIMIYISLTYSRITSYLNYVNEYIFTPYAFYFSHY